MEINYKSFATKNKSEKYIFLEDCIQKIDKFSHFNERDIKKFFRAIIQNEEELYLRKLSIEILSFLTAIDKVRRISTIDILLDLEEDDSPQIIISALKYLFSFYNYGSDDLDVINKIKSLRDSEDGEVSSEAYYRLGLISLLHSVNDEDRLSFYNQLEESQSFFKIATSLVENRIDAKYFYEVTKYLIFIMSEDEINAEKSLSNLLNLSFTRLLYSYNDKTIQLENKIQYILTNVYKTFQLSNSHDEWLDYLSEFTKLAECYTDFLNISLSGGAQEKLINNFKGSIDKNILEDLYIRNFSHYKAKMTNIQNQYPGDEVLNNFLNMVKNSIDSVEKKKDEKTSFLIETCLSIKEILPELDANELAVKVMELKNPTDVREILGMIKPYIEKKDKQNLDISTGDVTGEEILSEIISSINTLIPEYNPKKLSIFKRILEETIRYLILTIKSKRTESFKLFYTEKNGGKGDKITEREFQDNLYKHFQYSNIGYGAEEEINNFADGGRIDIVFKIQNFTFPMELKKTNALISKESIREKYLEQLNSYVYAYDQLGVFVVLDLNKKTKPVNDVRELVYIDHLEPLYKLGNKYPNYIVVIIVPGNKPLPSEKSTYG